MQEVKGAIGQMDSAFAIGRRLGLCQARQASGVHAAQLSVDISGRRVKVCKRSRHAWIPVAPVEAGAGEQPYSAVVQARSQR
jgi:hypothetical protein